MPRPSFGIPGSHRPDLPSRALALAVLSLALVLALPALGAKKNSKVEGKIVDETGQPVAEVAIVVSSPADPALKVETSSNDKGKFEVELAEARSDLFWSFQKEGHEPLITTIEIAAGKRSEVEITLPSDSSETARKRRAFQLYNDGVAAFNGDDKEGAKELFRQAAEADPTLTQAYLALAEASLQTGDAAGALAAARTARETDPENLEPRRLILYAAKDLEDWELVSSTADSLAGTDLAAGTAVAVYNVGVAALEAGEKDRAVRHFQKAAELDATLAPPHSAIATIKFNQQDFEGALEALETYLALKPDDVENLRLRYLAADALGDETLAAQARAAYEAAAPERAAAEGYERAEALFKANQLEEARTLLERILASDPEHVPANYTLGLCLLNSGDSAGARRQLRKVVELDPDSQQGRDAAEMLKHIQ